MDMVIDRIDQLLLASSERDDGLAAVMIGSCGGEPVQIGLSPQAIRFLQDALARATPPHSPHLPGWH